MEKQKIERGFIDPPVLNEPLLRGYLVEILSEQRAYEHAIDKLLDRAAADPELSPFDMLHLLLYISHGEVSPNLLDLMKGLKDKFPSSRVL